MPDYSLKLLSRAEIANMVASALRTSPDNDRQFSMLMSSLFAAYDEPHRGHHGFRHLQECMSWLAALKPLLGAFPEEQQDALTISLADHDYVYVPGKADNEERSALIGAETARNFGRPDSFCDLVHEFILASNPSVKPTKPILQLQHDMDWWIIGSPSDRYELYAAGIRKEFDDGSGKFVPGRLKFLEGTCKGQQVFLTPLFGIFEDQARLNIDWEIRKLKAEEMTLP